MGKEKPVQTCEAVTQVMLLKRYVTISKDDETEYWFVDKNDFPRAIVVRADGSLIDMELIIPNLNNENYVVTSKPPEMLTKALENIDRPNAKFLID